IQADIFAIDPGAGAGTHRTGGRAQSDKANVRDKPETPTETNRPDVPDENAPLSAEDLRAALGL
ncbi:hypothetical protein R6H00_00680, partial [Actinotignum timonense]|uniref:hypothetical protein n=1 Tax=Actinotignum timonense TaxID=1870995 RepID=UPI002A8362E4